MSYDLPRKIWQLGKVPAFISGADNRAMLSPIFPVETRMAYILKMREEMAAIQAQHGSGKDA